MRVRLLGLSGVQGAARRGARGDPRQQQSGDDHDRSGAGRPHLRRAADDGLSRGDHRARAARRHPADGGRPDGAQPCGRSRQRGHPGEIRRQADRRVDRGDQDRRGPAAVQGRDARHRPRSAAERARPEPARSGRPRAHARLPDRHPPVVHARRRRRRHRLQHRGIPRARGARARPEPGPPGAHRRVGDRLEGIRARGDARRRRQLRRDLLDREHRPDGRPHRRQHHGGADPDAQRQGIPADARCRAEDHPHGRRRDRRVQHSVRRQPRERPHGRHRDEPARVALLGARVEGDGLSDREDRRQARARLPPRRDPERHHARHAGLVRADHRLRRRQDSALELRKVPAGRPDAHDADEVGRRGDGDRPHLQGSLPEGRALAGARPQRSAVRRS